MAVLQMNEHTIVAVLASEPSSPPKIQIETATYSAWKALHISSLAADDSVNLTHHCKQFCLVFLACPFYAARLSLLNTNCDVLKESKINL